MLNFFKSNKSNENKLYTKIVLLTRNKLFYTKFDLNDTFQNRINLIFFHISFIITKVNNDIKKNVYKDFYQKLFDISFKLIEINMRELGYGDVSVNKNMKLLVKIFYSILYFCQNYSKKDNESKNVFFKQYLQCNIDVNLRNNVNLIEYFNKFQSFCFDLSSDSVLKGDLNFNYK